MGKTTIEWTGETWNPTRGCKPVSPGCANCYAEDFAGRFSGSGKPYEGLVQLRPGRGFKWTGTFREVPEALDIPLRRRAPTTWFVDSMSDLFGEGVSNEFIAAVFGVMAACPQHTFQVLTKRSTRLPEWMAYILDQGEELKAAVGEDPGPTTSAAGTACVMSYNDTREIKEWLPASAYNRAPWPLPNVWLGVSVEDRKHGLPRIEHLRRTPAALRFLSIEPLLEDLGELDLTGIDWVIVGGESGPGARPFDLAWARSIRDQCEAAGVPFFMKQAGANVITTTPTDRGPNIVERLDEVGARIMGHGWRVRLKDKRGGDLDELPPDLRIREMPELRRAT